MNLNLNIILHISLSNWLIAICLIWTFQHFFRTDKLRPLLVK